MKNQEIEKISPKSIYMMGDIHGDFDQIVRNIKMMEGDLLIQVGDFGIGFSGFQSERDMLCEINEMLFENNNHLIVVRGNHDLPECWRVNHTYNQEMSNILFVEDYTTLTIKGKSVMFVGGGVSIDRLYRKEWFSWWPDEDVGEIPEDLGTCDILVSHTCPSYHNNPVENNGFLKPFLEKDPDLFDDLKEERSIMDSIVELAKPKLNVHGHFHNDLRSEKEFEWGVCEFQTLDVDECRDFTKYFV